jgi:hypothetical protein
MLVRTCLQLCLLTAIPCSAAEPPAAWQVDEVVDIAEVWSGHPVGFSLLTAPPHQFVAFYDDQRQMTVGMRRLGETAFHLRRLASPADEPAAAGRRLPTTRLGWDSHNDVTMALDGDGHVHLCGNMHCTPLLYFRSERPFDVDSLRWMPAMVGALEDRVTYPRFFQGPNETLLFTYRHGRSGNGVQLFNAYQPAAATWRRLLDVPLFDGQGQRNAYFAGPVQSADGLFHVCWVWRNTSDCATNHDLSYARSRDLLHWQTSGGKPIELPITLERGEVVDPVPAGGGIINGNTRIGFDSAERVVLSYHKHDANGRTQLFNARREADGWRIYQTSDWQHRWDFSGGGSIVFEIRVSAVELVDDRLEQSYHHARHGSGRWLLDEATLRPVGPAPRRRPMPAVLGKLQSDFAGMQVRTAADLGTSGDAHTKYVLRWETLPANRDRPREGPLPAASTLRLYKLAER